MKIAFLVNKFPKISQTFILDQIVGLIERGHQVKIFARDKGNECQFHEEVFEYDLISKTSYFDIPENKIRRVLRAAPLVSQNILQNPRRIFEASRIRKHGRESISLKLLYNLLLFEDDDFDIIFCHFGPNGNLGVLLKQTDVNSHIVTMFHGYDVRLGYKEGPEIYEPTFEYSDLLLANSEATRESLINFGANPNKIILHPVGVDVDKFKNINNIAKEDEIVITTVARLEEIKGHKYAIQAVSTVLKSDLNKKIEYRIIGDGSKRDSLEEMVHELNIEDTVTFTGQIERSSVQKQLQETDIFVLPSIDEGLGVVLLEAQASGVPIVATDTGGIPQAVKGGESALLVPTRNSSALADKIRYMCENPGKRAEMGEEGRTHIKNNFNIESLNDRLANIFKDIID